MKISIDQSGKIEQTSQDTVIAYSAAKDVFDKKLKPNKILTIEDIIKAIKKTDGRLRECLATLVDAQARSYKKTIPKKGRKVK